MRPIRRLPAFLLVSVFLLGPSLEARRQVRECLVRVNLTREFPGILHEGRLITQTQVREIAEFNGVLATAQGVVVAFVGHHWPEFEIPGMRTSISTLDGRKYSARLVGVDERISLVVLESEVRSAPAAVFGKVQNPERLKFVAFTGGNWGVSELSVLKVEQSRLYPEQEVKTRPFSSENPRFAIDGSLVFDTRNRFIGIVNRLDEHPISKKMDVYRVIPAEVVQASFREILKRKGNISAGWLGVFLEPLSQQVRVKSVIPGSPADRFGLKAGDRILTMDDQSVDSRREFVNAIQWKGSTGQLRLRLDRGARQENVNVTLDEFRGRRPTVSWALEIPGDWNRDEPQTQVRVYRTVLPSSIEFGFVAEPLTPQLARFFKCPDSRGLLLKEILPDSPAEKSGFQAGDVLISINDEGLSSAVDLQRAIASGKDGVLVIRFVRDGFVRSEKIVLQ